MNVWLAPAKINLFLHVIGRRDDGYHELQTAFQLIDWHDELRFERVADGTVSRVPEIIGIEQSDDLTCRAARMLRERYGIADGIRIRLEKNIPISSGLGGGSSDAATTLIALNQIWKIGLGEDELAENGRELGADVPVFVRGKTAWAEGIGERLTALPMPPQLYLIAVPSTPVSTKLIFSRFIPTGKRERTTPESLDPDDMSNDLEKTTCEIYPEVQELLRTLRKFGPARMSGSGGALFLPVDGARQAQQVIDQLPNDVRTRICNGINVHRPG